MDYGPDWPAAPPRRAEARGTGARFWRLSAYVIARTLAWTLAYVAFVLAVGGPT